MIKMLLVAPLPPPYGGIANWVLLLRERISADDSVHMTALLNTAPRSGKAIGRSLWERVVGQGVDMFRLRRELLRSIKQDKPDVIHMTTSGSMAIVRDLFLMRAVEKYRIPVVYHLHFGRVPDMAASDNREWHLLQKAMRRATTVVTIDDRTYRTLTEYMPQQKLHNIPNFFDMSTVLKRDVALRKEVVFIGWCIPTKGIEELLSAWERLHGMYPDWTLRLVGPYDEAYVQVLRERFQTEAVIFDGEKTHEEAMCLLEAASVFTLPSHTEGFPNVVLEAMAYAKPIVATDVGAIRQMLEGDAGVVIPPKQIDALVSALGTLMDDEARRDALGRNARDRLEATYTVDVVFEQIKELWSDMSV